MIHDAFDQLHGDEARHQIIAENLVLFDKVRFIEDSKVRKLQFQPVCIKWGLGSQHLWVGLPVDEIMGGYIHGKDCFK